MSTINHPAIRYHGGKFRLAPWIMSFFPAHARYVESFGGAAGVLLQKPPVYAEIYNDLDRSVADFFCILRDPQLRQQLIEAVTLTPYARSEFDLAWIETDDRVESARRLAIRAQMGFGSAGATKGTTGFRVDTKREYGTAQDLWAQYPSTIAAVGQRFAGVLIENRPAIEVIRQHDDADTMHFVDPPYVLATRNRSGQGAYRHEMSDDQHLELIDALCSAKGYVVLSGYDSDLCHKALKGWELQKTRARIASNRGADLRTETVWINPACSAALRAESRQLRMFG